MDPARRCKVCLRGRVDRDGEAPDGRPRYRCGRCGHLHTSGWGEPWDTDGAMSASSPECAICGLSLADCEELGIKTAAFTGPGNNPLTLLCETCAPILVLDDDRAPTAEDLAPLDALLTGLGCCLHVYVEDLNARDKDLDFCIDWAERKGHTFCAALARYHRRIPATERPYRPRENDE